MLSVGSQMRQRRPFRYIRTYQTVMASEVEPPFVSATKTKGGSTPRPNSFLLIECNVGYAAWAAPATGARRSGRHDILLGFAYTNKGTVLVDSIKHQQRGGTKQW
jgi:hypothetical protein